MRRVLLVVRGVRIYSYPALLYLGLLCGFYVMYAIAPRLDLPRPRAAEATLVLFVAAIAGARLWFVVDHWSIYRGQPRRIGRYAEGGMSLYGGLMLALVFSPGLLGAMGLRFTGFWDAATFTMLVGMMFARVGCLLNGCCSGRPTEGRWGLWLADHAGHRARRYPVQLIELGCAAALLGGAALLLQAAAPRGTIFCFGLTGYAAVRWAVDPLREPAPASDAGRRLALTAFVAGSAAIFIAGWLVSGP